MEHQWSVSCCERYHFYVIRQIQGLDVANAGGKKPINKAKICSAELYENWRISELLVLAVLPASCPLLSCCVFNSPNSVIWNSVPLSYRAREMHLLQCSFSADTRTNMKKMQVCVTLCLHWGWLWLFVGEKTSCASKERLVWKWEQNTGMMTFAF